MNHEQFDKIVEAMPDGFNGFLKSWGLQQFAIAVERHVVTTKWIPSSTPPDSPKGLYYPVQVLAVIDVAQLFQLNGEQPFTDIASYWPALKKWTVTHQCRADEDAEDFEVRVSYWQPLQEPPKKGEMK